MEEDSVDRDFASPAFARVSPGQVNTNLTLRHTINGADNSINLKFPQYFEQVPDNILAI